MSMFCDLVTKAARVHRMGMSHGDAIAYGLAPWAHRHGLPWLEASNMARWAYHAPQPKGSRA